MNLENINKAIAIMERAGKVNMTNWQGTSDSKEALFGAKKHEAQLHECGTTACFAGWIAVSPEWKEFGGITFNGAPRMLKVVTEHSGTPAYALAKWFDLEEEIVNLFVYGEIYTSVLYHDDDGRQFSVFYDEYWRKVKAKDIITKLKILTQENGILKILKQYKKDFKPYADNAKFSACAATVNATSNTLDRLIKQYS